MTDPTVTQLPVTPDVPTFGRRTKPITYKAFDMAYALSKAPEHELTERFEIRSEIDGGSIYALMSAQNEAAQMAAIARIFANSLRDDDGVSMTYVPPAMPMTADEYVAWLEDEDPDGPPDDEPDPVDDRRADLLRMTIADLREVAGPLGVTVAAKPVKRTVVEDILTAEANRMAEDDTLDDEDEDDGLARDEDGLLVYLGPDGPTTDVGDLLVPHEAGSSRRRMAEIMDHPRYLVETSALTEVSRWLVSGQANRPTRKPRPSSTGPRRTGRGSRGR